MADHQVAFPGAILDTAFPSCGSTGQVLLRHYLVSHPYTYTHAGDKGGEGHTPSAAHLHGYGDAHAADADEDAHSRASYANGDCHTDVNGYSNSYAYAHPCSCGTLSHAPAHSGLARAS